jgi:prepilin-type N-terminal cleavage/methylation domain-containing protein
MKPRTRQHCSRTEKGFSLIEVSISIGIVAAVLLPTLAMLSGGGSMHTKAKDGAEASRIASSLTNSLMRLPGRGGFELMPDQDMIIPLPLPSGEEGASCLLALDETGRIQHEVDLATFEKGVPSGNESIYLARVQFRESKTGASFLNLMITVEYPARATQQNRDREIFQTRVAMP